MYQVHIFCVPYNLSHVYERDISILDESKPKGLLSFFKRPQFLVLYLGSLKSFLDGD